MLLLLIGLAAAILAGIGGIWVSLSPLTAAGPAGESTPYLLDRLTTDSGRTVFRLTAIADRRTFAHFSFHRHTASQVTLHVTRQSLDTIDAVANWEKKAHQEVISSDAQFPWWNASYLPAADFRLPSGRLIEESGDIFLVVAVDRTLSIYRYSEGEQEFLQFAGSLTESTRRRLFAETFSVDDVYWTYALVMNADYFLHGTHSLQPRIQAGIDIAALREEWERRQSD
ncbi:hypothetical protein [Blastopirellula marina]|uniref:Uncharacterized protein n=1 Tax=Blastopirellula marina TaxID=124 RepID=A0A2S8FA01_9BACT|nr:hypothetical protein [Blastopirellula marina]PQO28975.1 hypothetical protein C5Y98_22445 [Blastopirellula marina]PTL42247.1 hypothetical protein C5Y97_22455 [Blastopirellula marina]